MTLALWIPTDLQFGEPPAGEARQGAARQAVIQAIQHHLFAEAGASVETAFDQAIRAFARELGKPLSPRTRTTARALWSEWFPPEPLPAAAAGPDQIPEPVLAGFCWAVHGLCSELAFGWLRDDERDEEPEAEAEAPDPESPSRRRVEHHAAVTAIAGLLRLAHWRRLKATAGKTETEEDLRLIAAILLDRLLAVFGDVFSVVRGETVNRDGRPYTPKWIEPRSPALFRRIESLLAELPFRYTVQPLRRPVAYRFGDEGPADADARDCFRVDLIGYRRGNEFLRKFHAGFQSPEHRAPGFAGYVEAVNLQQAVPWRINRPLLTAARALCALAGDAAAAPPLRDWVRSTFYRPAPAGERKAILRPAEFLDSPLARRALDELCPAEGKPPAFYLPWKADYRGRLYAETPWLTPQGGDLQRALLEFATGRPLDGEGVRALRRHGANLVKRSRLLKDLGIADRQVVTLAERERWTGEHEADILASAAAPLAEAFWREAAGKPMQFLAFCLAYRQWKENPAAPIHLPVQIDGTCNGLQHIAALTGDEALARAVNVLPRPDGLPGDIYAELAAAAADALGRLACEQGETHREGLELADRWLAGSAVRRAWLNRDTAKKVVMTIPYGASAGAQAHYVLESIAAGFEREWRGDPSELPAGLEALVAWKEDNKSRRDFVGKCGRGFFSAQRKKAFSVEGELERALAHAHWQQMRTLAAYAARAIVHHLRAALAARYPAVDRFSHWLREVATACEGLPLLWLSPRGFPVCQDKFQLEGSSLTGRIGDRQIRIEVARLSEAVDDRGQKDALLPNLIHSLDATHLVMTLLGAAGRGVTDIGTIHDCLLCHPNDAALLGRQVRQAFAELYGRGEPAAPAGPLAEWRDWMAAVAGFRRISHLNLVRGALNEPGGMGERMLRGLAPSGEDEREALRYSLSVLEALRGLDPARRFLARILLEYLQDRPAPASGTSRLPAPSSGGGLPLASGLSDYFFS